ncbi:MAG TPA: hypothetical protein VFE88_01140 [Candidatus Nanoarchaeia archaeon]|nr:hypothetical protein [Candidatus Nanoarchaeia archaeon]
MKTLILGIILLLTSCVPQYVTDIGEQKCDLPYRQVNGACCLDKNANRVCDLDETQRSQTIVREKPLVLVQELCHFPRFECKEKTITKDFVQITLKLERDEIITVKKLILPVLHCQEEFDILMNRGDVHTFTVPCIIDQEVASSEASVEVIIKPILRYSNGQIYNYGILTPATLRGEIGGLVQQ